MSNVYATTPTNVIRADALAGVRTRRVLAVCVDFVLVSLLVAALWIVSIVLTFGLALFFLPPLFPFVAFFYNGLTVSGRNMATPGMRALDLEMRMSDIGRAGSVHQRGGPCGAVLRQLVLPAGLSGLAGRRGKAMPARHHRRRRDRQEALIRRLRAIRDDRRTPPAEAGGDWEKA